MIGLKPIKPDKDAIFKQTKKALEKQFTKALKDWKCPNHNRPVKVIVSGSLGNLKFDVKGCCKEFEDKVAKALEIRD